MYVNRRVWIRVMVFNATSNNISFILWWSVLLMEETGESGENHRLSACRWVLVEFKVSKIIIFFLSELGAGKSIEK